MCTREKYNGKLFGILFFVLVFAFFFLVMWFSPFASDDIEFRAKNLHSFKDIFQNALYYGNGRLLGNISVYYLVNNKLVGSLIRAVVLSLIVVLLPLVINMKTPIGYALSFFLVVSVNPEVFGQVFSWASGFSNYVFPILLGIINFAIIEAVEKEECKKVLGILGSLAVFVSGLCAQLFVENTSTTFVLLSFALLFNGIKRRQKFLGARIAWLISSLLGMLVMVSIPKAFFREGNRTIGYRGFGGDSVLEAVKNAVKSVGVILHTYAGCVFISLAVLIFIILIAKKQEGLKLKVYLLVSSSLAEAFILFASFTRQNKWYGLSISDTIISYYSSGLWALILIVNFIIGIHLISDIDVKRKSLFCMFFSAVSVVQLVIVYPISVRTIWISLMFTCVTLMLLGKYAFASVKVSAGIIEKVALASCTVFGLSLLLTFGNIHELDILRENHINRELSKGNTEINIFAIPSDYAFWDSEWAYIKWVVDKEGNNVEFTVVNVDSWLLVNGYR